MNDIDGDDGGTVDAVFFVSLRPTEKRNEYIVINSEKHFLTINNSDIYKKPYNFFYQSLVRFHAHINVLFHSIRFVLFTFFECIH